MVMLPVRVALLVHEADRPPLAIRALHLVDSRDVVETAQNEVEHGGRVAHGQIRRYCMNTVGNVFDGHAQSKDRLLRLDPSRVASPMTASWNQITEWLRQFDGLRVVAQGPTHSSATVQLLRILVGPGANERSIRQ